MLRFQNVKNRCVEVGGESIWISRSVALIGLITASLTSGDNYVLISQRGPNTPDPRYVGTWNLVCGYLDWNESAKEGLLREAWEETGLDLLACEEQGLCTIADQPILVQSNPKTDARQNVSLVFRVSLQLSALPELSNQYADPGEVDAVQWLPLQASTVHDLSFAFGHGALIDQYLLNKVETLSAT